MAIKQFNAGWSKKEDRITLSLNTSEGEVFRFWITRFIAKHLLQGSQSMIQANLETKHNARASQVIQEFQKDAVKEQLNLHESFEGGDKTPLGDEPVLVIGLNLQSNNKAVTIGLQLDIGKTATFELPLGQLQPLIVLLEKLAADADWQLSSEDSSTSNLMHSSDSLKNNPTKLH
jgi:hypothetical protein